MLVEIGGLGFSYEIVVSCQTLPTLVTTMSADENPRNMQPLYRLVLYHIGLLPQSNQQEWCASLGPHD